MYYLIRESLTPCGFGELKGNGGEAQYVAVLTTAEWQECRDSFDMMIDMDMDEISPPHETKAVVNQDSLTGSFSIPDRQDISGTRHSFSFALDEKALSWWMTPDMPRNWFRQSHAPRNGVFRALNGFFMICWK